MTIYTCEPTWEAMLSCIYTAWMSKKGHQNIRLEIEPIEQYTLFDEYLHVDIDMHAVQSVADAVKKKISPYAYREFFCASLGYERDRLDTIYRCMILGFAYGPAALNMVQYRDIMRYQEISSRVKREINRFQEILRFHRVEGNVYAAHFEPKSRIVSALGPIFEDRMPSEHWMIIDDVHREAVVHRKDEPFFVRTLNEEEFQRLLETENRNDAFTDMWRVFFETIAIRERKNEKLQRSLYPLWTRTHAVEFHSHKQTYVQ